MLSFVILGSRPVRLAVNEFCPFSLRHSVKSINGIKPVSYTHLDTKIIVNVCGKTIKEYLEVVERLADTDVDMLEINVSCPNVKEGAIAFGQKADCLSEITSAIKKVAKQPIIMKLSPNVTDITEMAMAAEDVYKRQGMNSSYLSTLFKNEVGTGFVEYLNEVRLERAKELMDSSQLRLKEIIDEVGFCSYPYFFSLFKKKYGMTPKEYQKGQGQ